MTKPRISLFAEQEREDRRSKLGDPLVGLAVHVDFVFGALAQMGGKLVRCLGIVRTTFALNLKAASYNLKRLVLLKEYGVATF